MNNLYLVRKTRTIVATVRVLARNEAEAVEIANELSPHDWEYSDDYLDPLNEPYWEYGDIDLLESENDRI